MDTTPRADADTTSDATPRSNSAEPPVAEAARSTVLTASDCLLWSDGRDNPQPIAYWTIDAVGDVLLALPDGDPTLRHATVAGELPVRIQLLDTSPAVVRDRLRSRLDLTGWACVASDAHVAWAGAQGEAAPDGYAVLHVEVVTVRLDEVDVDLDAYRGAEPDPLASREIDLLLHLVAGHAAELVKFAALLPEPLRRASSRIAPLRLHRRALVLRVECGDDDLDVLLPLPPDPTGQPPSTPMGILDAVRRMVVRCPHHPGCR